MAGCNRWVGGRRRSKQEVIITLPAAALHLLTTWTDWKKFSNKLNINRCSSPQAQTHAHVGFFFLFKPHASLFVSCLFVFFVFSFRGLFLSLQKRGNIQNYIRSLRWCHWTKNGKVHPEQKDTSPKRVRICGWSVCVRVCVCVCICVHGDLPVCVCLRLSQGAFLFEGNFDSLAPLF